MNAAATAERHHSATIPVSALLLVLLPLLLLPLAAVVVFAFRGGLRAL